MDAGKRAGTGRRGSRPARSAIVGRMEALEPRLLLANGVVLDDGTPVAANFIVVGNTHQVRITQVDQDPDRDGNVGTPNVTFRGTIEGPFAGDFSADHLNLRLEALRAGSGGATIGSTTAFPITGPGRVSFTLDAALDPNEAGVQNVQFRIGRQGFGTVVIRRNDNGQPLRANLTVVDMVSPRVVDVVDVTPDPRNNPPEPIQVDFSEPINPATFDFNDLQLTRDGAVVPLNGGVTIAPLSASSYRIDGLAPFASLSGSYRLAVNAAGIADVAGNLGTPEPDDFDAWVIDLTLNRPPTPNAPVLRSESDTGTPGDGITAATALTFDATGVEPGNTVELLRSGPGGGGAAVPVASRIGPGPITDAGAPAGRFSYSIRQIDGANPPSIASAAVAVAIDRQGPSGTAVPSAADQTFTGSRIASTANPRPTFNVTLSDPPGGFVNPIRVELIAVNGQALATPVSATVAIPADGTTATVSGFAPPIDLVAGLHRVDFRLTDAAGNSTVFASDPFFIQEDRPVGAPGSPVFGTVYDLRSLVPPSAPGTPAVGLYPWNASFDRTTQTIWFELRGQENLPAGARQRGNHIIQLDPATHEFRTYDLGITGGDSTGAHSIFFDFESHATPRVWVAQRLAGTLSYLDLATGEFVTYDLTAVMNQARGVTHDEAADVHAVVVDRRGVAWISAPHEGVIIEVDTRRLLPGGGVDVASDAGSVKLHPIPQEYLDGYNLEGPNPGLPFSDVGTHGLDVVIDDRPGAGAQPYVYFTVLGSGRVGLLIPAIDTIPGRTQDRWASWDLREALAEEGSVTVDGKPYGHPLFVTIDNAETPGTPEDDRLFVGDPGAGLGANANSAVRVLHPGNVILDPNAATSPVQTWQLTPADGMPRPQPNQIYVDREGGTFFIDRQAGFGRMSTSNNTLPGALQTPGRTIQAPIARFVTDRTVQPLAPTLRRAIAPTIAVVPPSSEGTVFDGSAFGGLDQYRIQGTAATGGRGELGPFRGTINAGSTIYGSLTQNDQFATALFAETVRRPVDAILGPDGARLAFQVLRSGDLILTRRGPGDIVDGQTNVTRSAFPGQVGPGFVGNVASTVDAAGIVHVFGQDGRGGLNEYRLDHASGAWSVRVFALPGIASELLAGSPTAVTLANGTASALITTGAGHLLLFRSDRDAPIDLSGAGSTSIYGAVGQVTLGGTLFVYGTDMAGNLVEYAVEPAGASASSRTLTIPGGPGLRVFQDVEVVVVGGVRHVLATNGASQLVDVQIDGSGNIILAQNVSQLVQPTANGYSAYQRPFAGRVYSHVSAAVDPTTGLLYVYGTNGRDLVEFRRATDGTWQASNLTNDLFDDGTNTPANRVFGAPAVLIRPDGERQILLINEDGEVIEYYKLAGLPFGTFNLALGRDNNLFGDVTPVAAVDDHANTAGPAATPIAFDPAGRLAVASGRIGTRVDADAFRFVAPRTGRFVIEVAPATRGFRPQIAVFNAQGRRIGLARGRRLVINGVAGQTYSVVIRGRRRSLGDYTLRVQAPTGPGTSRPPILSARRFVGLAHPRARHRAARPWLYGKPGALQG